MLFAFVKAKPARSWLFKHPGMINDTVSHLLVVSFNHLKTSIQLTVKAHPGASERRISLSATSAPHPSSSQTF